MRAARAAAGQGRRLAQVSGSFDEFNLDFELLYEGPPLMLESAPKHNAAGLLDMQDEEFQNAVGLALASVSHVLLKRLADRVTSGTRGQLSYLRLHFSH